MDRFELPPPDAAAPAPAFADADAAKAWLAGQPLAMPAKLQIALADQLERVDRSPCAPFDRALMLEALRNAAATTQAAMRKKFAFAARPLSAEPREAFDVAQRLWAGLANGYLRCLEAFADDPATDRQWLAIAAHRALITCRLATEDHFVAGIEVPEALLDRLLRILQAACLLGIAETKVADPEYRDPSTTTAAEQFAVAALLHLADPYHWGGASYTVAQRIFMRWRNQISVADCRDNDPKLRWIPLTAVSPLTAPLDEHSPQWLEIHAIRRKLRKRIEALAGGESPESLQLGRELAAGACRELLESVLDHLRAAYSESRDTVVRVDSACELAVGPAGCFELLTNKTFAPEQTLSAASSRILHDRIAMFGSASRVESVEKTVAVEGERWQLVAESVAVAKLARPAGDTGARMLPGQLVVFRDARSAASLAIVIRVWTRQNGATEISLRRFPGKPQALTARAADSLNDPAFPLFVLPAVAAVASPASILLPTGIAARLRKGLEARGESYLCCTPATLLERGADFERYTYEER